ncbi:MAG TPA: M67 family metallopeptidase [Paludibacter sp.]|nr:M67 family metallopeptidase [Paludibacter sp.]
MIKLPAYIYDGIVAQAYAELPNEACGLLTGKGNEVVKQHIMTNVDRSNEHFSFDPAEQFQVLRAARSEGLEIVANYHSHPGTPSRPSVEDIRLAYDPDILYLIVSLAAEIPVLKAFRIVDGVSSEVGIEVVQV